MSDIEKIFILAATLWVTAVGFIIFSWMLEVKRQQVLLFIAKRLTSLDRRIQHLSVKLGEPDVNTKHQKDTDTIINIPKNAPLSAYESVTLPDNTSIHFIDEHAP